MALVEEFLKLRPWLYHLTASANVNVIRNTRRLLPAAKLAPPDSASVLLARRPLSVTVQAREGLVIINDQAPLHANNMSLTPGFTFEDLLGLLNEHVFFWPGMETKLVDSGMSFLGRYNGSPRTLLRIPTTELFERYPRDIRFCRYNSGAPRASGGRKSPRGPNLFQVPDQFNGTAGKVVEVAFPTDVELPASVEIATGLTSPWTRLFH